MFSRTKNKPRLIERGWKRTLFKWLFERVLPPITTGPKKYNDDKDYKNKPNAPTIASHNYPPNLWSIYSITLFYSNST